jgi:septum formation protein
LPEAGRAPSRLVLGSASPRRLQLLAQIGVVPDAVVPAEIDETPRRGELPRAYVRRMAAEKCAAVELAADGVPFPLGGDGGGGDVAPPFILAADTAVSVGRRILG